MNINDPVSTVMSRSVVVATQFHNFSDVLELFSHHGMHHLPIVDGGNKLIGIISSNDVMKLFSNPKYKDLKINTGELDKAVNIHDIMTPNPITVSSTDSIQHAAQIYASHGFHALPVVNNGEIVGILSIKDIVRLVAYF